MLNVRRTTLAITATALLLAATNACSSTPTTTAPAGDKTPTAPAASSTAVASTPAKAAPPKDAAATLTAIAKTVTTAKAGTVITEANDGNHLLGRPGQYTSKVTFTDSRINTADVASNDPTDVGFGGSIEVFASADDAKRRTDYIQSIGKSMPALLEYDFPHGSVLVRVSKLLAPAQAGEYDKAAAALG